jgi:hypothetical protein
MVCWLRSQFAEEGLASQNAARHAAGCHSIAQPETHGASAVAGGKRSAEENWDVYEYAGGQALLSLVDSKVSWLPTLTSPVWYAVLFVWLGRDVANIGTLVAIGLLAGFSAVFPDRTLQDRLAGTWLVPR